jgi:hypothetical protein
MTRQMIREQCLLTASTAHRQMAALSVSNRIIRGKEAEGIITTET